LPASVLKAAAALLVSATWLSGCAAHCRLNIKRHASSWAGLHDAGSGVENGRKFSPMKECLTCCLAAAAVWLCLSCWWRCWCADFSRPPLLNRPGGSPQQTVQDAQVSQHAMGTPHYVATHLLADERTTDADWRLLRKAVWTNCRSCGASWRGHELCRPATRIFNQHD
jgi:hypothetical protein